MRPPRFWQKRGVIPTLLSPLGWLWLGAAGLRQSTTQPTRAALPVICIGNITSGGTGKTSLTAAIAEAAIARGWRPAVLTRGHGGNTTGPMLVSHATTAEAAGDEAILLRQTCPVVVSRNRGRGAAFITAENCGDLILMDDGMQNPGIVKDRLVVVFNGRKGIENGHIIPAGPLRESLAAGLKRAQAVAITGADETGLEDQIHRIDSDMMIAAVSRQFDAEDIKNLRSKPVIAFAGIGDNEGFFTMLADAGVRLEEQVGFADHHVYTAADIIGLKSRAEAAGADLVTTAKDIMRIKDMPEAAAIRAIRLTTTVPTSLLDRILPQR